MNTLRYDDDRLLDAFRATQGWDTDIEVSRYLKLTRATVSQIRRRLHRLTPEHRLMMLEGVGYVSKGFCNRLSVPALAYMLICRTPALAHQMARFQKDRVQLCTDPELLDMAKVALDIKYDRKLALILRTPYQNVYVIRKGRNFLSIESRLWLLEQFEPCGAESLIELLDSAERVLQIIERNRPAS